MSRADNPIVQTVYTADPAPLVHNGRVYLFTGHDEDDATWFDMRDWLLFSSADMVNWKHHPSPMSVGTFSWATANAWAGQVIARNDCFYYYVPVTARATGQMAIGVGVSDTIEGPYVDAIGAPLVENGQIDPTVYIDDNGQAYLYWGNPDLIYITLNPDMVSYSGTINQVNLTTEGFGTRLGNPDRITTFEEGPWAYKRNGVYYMVYAANCCAEDIRYSTSLSSTGPWMYRDVIMPAQGSSFTNHVGIVDLHEKSYFFYHNGALPGGGGFARAVAVESFDYNTDGTIPTIQMTTDGPSQVGTLDPYIHHEAVTMAWSEGIQTEPSSEGGLNVAFINDGDYIKVRGVAFSRGTTSFTARVASESAGGNLELHLGSQSGPLVGTCIITNTGGWQQWTTVTCPVAITVGTHDIFFRFTGTEPSYLFNFKWWRFAEG